MFAALQNLPVALLLLMATALEVGGDAVVRIALYQQTGLARVAWFLVGAALLFGYGTFLNSAPIDFGRVVGLYIAVLFVVWQVINFIAFRSLPQLSIWVGGTLIIAGGLIVTYWRPE